MGKAEDIGLKDKYTFEYGGINITLTKSGEWHRGANKLSDIQWFLYEMKIQGLIPHINEYDRIGFMFTPITKENFTDSMLVMINVSKENAVYRNIDLNTGNVHPSKEDVEVAGYDEIKQLVLFNGNGPLTMQLVENDEYYIYSAVHKACYYPLIEDNDDLKNNIRYKFLRTVGEVISNAGAKVSL
ncbi:MAG: hypothetical protein IKR76_04725, partial [Ruminococcus sp.]|nr:hypothetical protein [Ruminococcus sp.]